MQALSGQSFSLTPSEKVNLGLEHKVSSWLVEGLTALVSGELSPDSLEEAFGLRMAYRIASMQLLSRKPTMVSTVMVGGQHRTGVSLSALYCGCCIERFVKEKIKCNSCSAELNPTAPGTGYLDGTISPVMVGHSLGSCFYFSVDCVYCSACSGKMIHESFPCHSCSHSTSLTENVYACHDPPIYVHHRASSIELSIRETFRDEIQECDL